MRIVVDDVHHDATGNTGIGTEGRRGGHSLDRVACRGLDVDCTGRGDRAAAFDDGGGVHLIHIDQGHTGNPGGGHADAGSHADLCAVSMVAGEYIEAVVSAEAATDIGGIDECPSVGLENRHRTGCRGSHVCAQRQTGAGRQRPLVGCGNHVGAVPCPQRGTGDARCGRGIEHVHGRAARGRETARPGHIEDEIGLVLPAAGTHVHLLAVGRVPVEGATAGTDIRRATAATTGIQVGLVDLRIVYAGGSGAADDIDAGQRAHAHSAADIGADPQCGNVLLVGRVHGHAMYRRLRAGEIRRAVTGAVECQFRVSVATGIGIGNTDASGQIRGIFGRARIHVYSTAQAISRHLAVFDGSLGRPLNVVDHNAHADAGIAAQRRRTGQHVDTLLIGGEYRNVVGSDDVRAVTDASLRAAVHDVHGHRAAGSTVTTNGGTHRDGIDVGRIADAAGVRVAGIGVQVETAGLVQPATLEVGGSLGTDAIDCRRRAHRHRPGRAHGAGQGTDRGVVHGPDGRDVVAVDLVMVAGAVAIGRAHAAHAGADGVADEVGGIGQAASNGAGGATGHGCRLDDGIGHRFDRGGVGNVQRAVVDVCRSGAADVVDAGGTTHADIATDGDAAGQAVDASIVFRARGQADGLGRRAGLTDIVVCAIHIIDRGRVVAADGVVGHRARARALAAGRASHGQRVLQARALGRNADAAATVVGIQADIQPGIFEIGLCRVVDVGHAGREADGHLAANGHTTGQGINRGRVRGADAQAVRSHHAVVIELGGHLVPGLVPPKGQRQRRALGRRGGHCAGHDLSIFRCIHRDVAAGDVERGGPGVCAHRIGYVVVRERATGRQLAGADGDVAGQAVDVRVVGRLDVDAVGAQPGGVARSTGRADQYPVLIGYLVGRGTAHTRKLAGAQGCTHGEPDDAGIVLRRQVHCSGRVDVRIAHVDVVGVLDLVADVGQAHVVAADLQGTGNGDDGASGSSGTQIQGRLRRIDRLAVAVLLLAGCRSCRGHVRGIGLAEAGAVEVVAFRIHGGEQLVQGGVGGRGLRRGGQTADADVQPHAAIDVHVGLVGDVVPQDGARQVGTVLARGKSASHGGIGDQGGIQGLDRDAVETVDVHVGRRAMMPGQFRRGGVSDIRIAETEPGIAALAAAGVEVQRTTADADARMIVCRDVQRRRVADSGERATAQDRGLGGIGRRGDGYRARQSHRSTAITGIDGRTDTDVDLLAAIERLHGHVAGMVDGTGSVDECFGVVGDRGIRHGTSQRTALALFGELERSRAGQTVQRGIVDAAYRDLVAAAIHHLDVGPVQAGHGTESGHVDAGGTGQADTEGLALAGRPAGRRLATLGAADGRRLADQPGQPPAHAAGRLAGLRNGGQGLAGGILQRVAAATAATATQVLDGPDVVQPRVQLVGHRADLLDQLQQGRTRRLGFTATFAATAFTAATALGSHGGSRNRECTGTAVGGRLQAQRGHLDRTAGLCGSETRRGQRVVGAVVADGRHGIRVQIVDADTEADAGLVGHRDGAGQGPDCQRIGSLDIQRIGGDVGRGTDRGVGGVIDVGERHRALQADTTALARNRAHRKQGVLRFGVHGNVVGAVDGGAAADAGNGAVLVTGIVEGAANGRLLGFDCRIPQFETAHEIEGGHFGLRLHADRMFPIDRRILVPVR